MVDYKYANRGYYYGQSAFEVRKDKKQVIDTLQAEKSYVSQSILPRRDRYSLHQVAR